MTNETPDKDALALALIRDECREVGSDPEMADAANPRGVEYGTLFWVEVHTCYGEIYQHLHAVTVTGPKKYAAEDPEYRKLERLREAVENAIRRDDGWTPIGNPHWRYSHNAYGSQAYIDNWEEEEEDRNRLDREADLAIAMGWT